MFLDAVKRAADSADNNVMENGAASPKGGEVYGKWADWLPSQISHHGAMCCEVTREWVTAMDFSELGGADVLTGPRWLRQRFNWGCSTFPIYWCEAVRRDTLDCGALAALSHEVFLSRSVKSVRVQLVQKFTENATAQWSSSWHDGNTELEWVHNDLIYHEGCAIVLADNRIKVWDSSAGWWIDTKQRDGYGSVLALRIAAPVGGAEVNFQWGNHSLAANKWELIKQDAL